MKGDLDYMQKYKKMISLIIINLMILMFCYSSFSTFASTVTSIKNVIFMIPDGGAMAPFYLANAVKQVGGFDKTKYPNVTPVEAGEMYIKNYLVGAETTYSANNPITDSAASGTALSSGYKTNNGYIGVDTQGKPHANILEACQDMGKNTGMVVTYEWTNATPSAFSAHDISRVNMTTMSEQIVNQGIDVVIGNTNSAFSDAEWFTDSALLERGYKVIKNKDQLLKVRAGDRIWGKLPAAYYDTNRASTTPNLAELTKTAITALDDGNAKGFFLMVEGSAVDGGGHANDAVYMVSEYLAFDEACKVAIEYAKDRNDTMVIIAPDHDTGGLYYNYSDIDKIVDDIKMGTRTSLVSWETTNHTNRNGGIFMYLPEGVSYPNGIDPNKAAQVETEFYSTYGTFSQPYPSDAVNVINNIDIPKYISSLIGVDLDRVTGKLFVDVTDQGTYNSATEIFTFTNKDITVKRNSSTALINGNKVDLDGEIALYIEGKFYVPQRLFTYENELNIVEGSLLSANYNTGKLSYSGKVDFGNSSVFTIVTKPGSNYQNVNSDDIVSINQTTADSNGNYSFDFIVDKFAGSYTIYTNYSDGPNKPLTKSFAFKNTISTMTVTKDGINISKINQIATGNTLNIKLGGFDLENNYPGLVIVCQYVAGALSSAEFMHTNGGSVYFGDEIEKNFTVIPNADKIKICYWNSNSFMPLIAAYTID